MGQDESCGTTQFDAHASAFFHTRLICAVRITGTVPVVATCRMGVHSTLTRPFPLFRAAALPPSAARCTPYHRGTFPVHRFYGAIITGNTLLSRNFLSNFAAFHLTAVQKILIIAFAVNRGVAQLVARLVRDQEVASSNLVASTSMRSRHSCGMQDVVFLFMAFYDIKTSLEPDQKMDFTYKMILPY